MTSKAFLRTATLMGGMATFMMACATPTPPPEPPRLPPQLSAAINTCATLVPIMATSTASGLAEQDAWLARNYPGAVKVRQTVVQCESKPVEIVTFRHSGAERSVLFDISNFFGRVGTDNLDDLLAG